MGIKLKGSKRGLFDDRSEEFTMKKMTVTRTFIYVLIFTITGLGRAESENPAPPANYSWSDPEIDAFLRGEGADGISLKPGNIRTAFGVFGDVYYSDKSGTNDDKFGLGQLVVHGLADFGKGYGAFFEATLNSDTEWETRLERLQIFWEKSDNFKLSAGRFHVPVTWWNSTYHHGLWLQTTTKRPLMIGYDNAFVPNHAIGLVAEGLIPGLEDAGLRYIAGISGGDNDSQHSHDPVPVQMETAGAAHDHKTHTGPDNHKIMPMAGILFRPPTLPRLQLGTVAYTEKYEWNGEEIVDYLALGAHAVYTSEQPELIAEYVRTAHEVSNHPDSFESWSAYVQIAWRLATSGAAAKFKPYTRIERIEVQDHDPLLMHKTSTDRVLAGVRTDLTANLALKLEYIRTELEEDDAAREVMLQAVMKW